LLKASPEYKFFEIRSQIDKQFEQKIKKQLTPQNIVLLKLLSINSSNLSKSFGFELT
jgi:hypothetical protein